MTPNQKFLVSSFFEIANTPGIILTIDKGLLVDQTMQVISGFLCVLFVLGPGARLSKWQALYYNDIYFKIFIELGITWTHKTINYYFKEREPTNNL